MALWCCYDDGAEVRCQGLVTVACRTKRRVAPTTGHPHLFAPSTSMTTTIQVWAALFLNSPKQTPSSSSNFLLTPAVAQSSTTMAARTLEARFERMSVNDENDPLGDGSKIYSKSKVRMIRSCYRPHDDQVLTVTGGNCFGILATPPRRQSTEPLQGCASITNQQHRRHPAFAGRATKSRLPYISP